MLNQEKIQQFQEVFGRAASVLVLLPPNPTLDQTAAALALYSASEATGKDVSICCPETDSIAKYDLQTSDKIVSDLGKRDLCVSFDYKPEAIDKVSYNIDEAHGKFYLLIKPQKGHKPLPSESVQFSYSGADADLVFLVGVNDLESLEHLYFGYEQLYQSAQVAALNNYESDIGTMKFDASGMSSLSEAMTQLLADSGYSIPSEAATNLLAAIESSTDNLASLTITADTFERLAFLLRSGAFRKRRQAQRLNNPNNARSFAQQLQQAQQLSAKALPREIPFDGRDSQNPRQNFKPQKGTPAGRPPGGKKNKNSKPGGLDYQPGEGSSGSKV